MGLHVDYTLDISELPEDCIRDCCHPGPCDDDVAFWRKHLGLTVDRDNAIRCLKGYGAWEPEELAAWSDERLAETVLWLACGDFSSQLDWERDNPDADPMDSDCGSSCFCLE
jgi:hypothetical protein